MHCCLVKGFSEIPHPLPVMSVSLFTRVCSLHRSLMRVGSGTQDGFNKCLLEGTTCGRALCETVYSLGLAHGYTMLLGESLKTRA